MHAALQSAGRMQRRADWMVWIAVLTAATIMLIVFLDAPF